MNALTDILKRSKNKGNNTEVQRKKRKRTRSDEYDNIDYSKLNIRNSKLNEIKKSYKVQKSKYLVCVFKDKFNSEYSQGRF